MEYIGFLYVGEVSLIPESDKMMGQLVVDAGYLSSEQLNVYLNDVAAGRKEPNSLIRLLSQSGRIQPNDIDMLRARWQSIKNGQAPSGPQHSGPEAEIQTLVLKGILNNMSAQKVRTALTNWENQGSVVSVRDAIIHLQLANPSQVEDALNGSSPNMPHPAPLSRNGFQSSLSSTPPADAGKRTEVLSFTGGLARSAAGPAPLPGAAIMAPMPPSPPMSGFGAPMPLAFADNGPGSFTNSMATAPGSNPFNTPKANSGNNVFPPLGGFGGTPQSPVMPPMEDGFAQTITDAPPQALLEASQVTRNVVPSPFGQSAPMAGSMAGPMAGTPFGGPVNDPSPFGPAASMSGPIGLPVSSSLAAPPLGLSGGAPNPFGPSSSMAAPGGMMSGSMAPGGMMSGSMAPGGMMSGSMAPGGGGMGGPFGGGAPAPFSAPVNSPFGAPGSSAGASRPFDKKVEPAKPGGFGGVKDKSPTPPPKREKRSTSDRRSKKKEDKRGDGKRRKGGKRKKGLPLVPIAVGTAGLIVSLGVILIFFVIPRNRARALYEKSRSHEQAGEFIDALKTLDLIAPAFVPHQVPILRRDINNQLRVRTVEWIKKIEQLVDQDKLKQAEETLQETLEKSLTEDHERIDEKRTLISAAKICREARALGESDNFKEALSVVRKIERKNLTENNLGIEDDIISLLNAYIRTKKKDILPFARSGNKTRAMALIAELEEKCDPRVAPRIDELKREVERLVQEKKLAQQSKQSYGQIKELIGKRKYFQAQMILQQIEQQKPGSIQQNRLLANYAKTISGFFFNRWKQVIQRTVSLIKAGNKNGAYQAYSNLKVEGPKNQPFYFFVNEKSRRINVLPLDQAQVRFKQIVDRLETQLKPGG
jgi:hypothetical protein